MLAIFYELLLQALEPIDSGNAWLDQHMRTISETGILTLDQARYVFCAFLAYPLAFLYRFVPNKPALKSFIGMVLGLWFGYFVFGAQIVHSILSATIVYLLVKLLPRNISHVAVFIFAMGYVCISHIYRMYVDYLGWTLDFTGPQMLLTMKFTFYAFDMHDYHLNAKQLDEYAGEAPKDPTKRNFLREYITSARLPREPSLIEYYGYMFFFANFLAGPVPSLKTYLTYVDGSMFAETGGVIPASSFSRSLLIFLYALIWAPGTIIAGRYVPLWWCQTADFAAQSYGARVLYTWMAASMTRPRYYFGWLLSEGANILSGIGYNGKDKKTGKIRWDGASNVRAVSLEMAQSLKDVSDNWNLSANFWLRNYIYLRVPASLAAYNTYVTYFVSACWHGFYPGYYVAFIGSAVFTNLYREVFRKIRPRFLTKTADGKDTESLLYRIVAIPLCSFVLGLLFIPFVEVDFHKALNIYKHTYFLIYIIMAIMMVGLKFVRAPRSKKEDAAAKPAATTTTKAE